MDVKINNISIKDFNDDFSVFFNETKHDHSFKLGKRLSKQLFEFDEEIHYSFKKESSTYKEVNVKELTEEIGFNPFSKSYVESELIKIFEGNSNFEYFYDFTWTLNILLLDSIDGLVKKYKRYSLKPFCRKNEDQWGIRISFCGYKKILDKKISALDEVEKQVVNKIFYNNSFRKMKYIEDVDLINNSYPLLNRQLANVLNINITSNYHSSNPVKDQVSEITNFYNNYLKGKSFTNGSSISNSGYKRGYIDNDFKIAYESNQLIFGNNEQNFNVFSGLKLHGPYQGLPKDKKVKFIFIFKNGDKEYANKLYLYLKKGYKNFPGLKEFIGVPFEIDTKNSIAFSQENPIDDIRKSLDKVKLDEDASYMALYISPYRKDETDNGNDEIYYKIKECLLSKAITSQVLFKNNILEDNFNFFLPNISIAILAKFGGIPWLLNSDRANSAVIGFGAKKHKGENYIGNTISFNSLGKFTDFKVLEGNSPENLGKAFEDALKKTIDSNTKTIIIHYYKTMSNYESKILLRVLENMDIDIPFVVLNINKYDKKSGGCFCFDDSFEGKIPISGTIVKLGYNDFLLSNNTRYSSRVKTKISNFPFPIRVRVSKSKDIDLNEKRIIKFLLNQVYQFSRIYWKSVRQKGNPVTIEYSEMVANIVSHFEKNELPDNHVSKNTLWFL